MGLWAKLTETRESAPITGWDCPFCDHISWSEKAAEKHIAIRHGNL